MSSFNPSSFLFGNRDSRTQSPIQGAAAASATGKTSPANAAAASPSNAAASASYSPKIRFLSEDEEKRLYAINDQKITFKYISFKQYQELDIPLFNAKEFVQDLVEEFKERGSLLENPRTDVLVQGRYVGQVAIENYNDYNDIDLCFECKKLEKPEEFVKILDAIFIKLIAARLSESFKNGKTEEDLAQIIQSHYLDRFRRCPPPYHYMYTLSLPGMSSKGTIDLCFIQKGTYQQGAAASDFLKVVYLAPRPYFVASQGFSVEVCIEHLRRRIYAFCFKVGDVHAALWRYLCKVGQGNLVLFSKDEDFDKLLASFLKPYPVELMAIKLKTLDGQPFPQDEEGQKKWKEAHEVFEQFRKDFKNHLEKHASNGQGASFALLNLLQSLSRLKGLKYKEREVYLRSLSYILEVLPGHDKNHLAKFLKGQSEDVSLLLDFIQGAFLFEWMKGGKEKGISAYRFDFARKDEPRFQICVGGHFLAVDASPDKLALQFLRAWTTLEQKFKNSPEKQEVFQGILKGLGITSLEFSPEQRGQVSEAILKNFESSPVIEVLDNQFNGNISLESFYRGLIAHVADHSYLQKKILQCQLKEAKKITRNGLERSLLEQCVQFVDKGMTSENLKEMTDLLEKSDFSTKPENENQAAAAAANSSKTTSFFYKNLLRASLTHVAKEVLAHSSPQKLLQLQTLMSSAVKANLDEESAKSTNNELIYKEFLNIANSGEEGVRQLMLHLQEQLREKRNLEQEKNGFFCLRAILCSTTQLSEPMKKELAEILEGFLQGISQDHHPLFFQFFGLVLSPAITDKKIFSENQVKALWELGSTKLLHVDRSEFKSRNKKAALDLLELLNAEGIFSKQLLPRLWKEMISAMSKENEAQSRQLLEILRDRSNSQKEILALIDKLSDRNTLSKRDPTVVEDFIALVKLSYPEAVADLVEETSLFCISTTRKQLLELSIENQKWEKAYELFMEQDLFAKDHKKLFQFALELLKAFLKDKQPDFEKIKKLRDAVNSLIERQKNDVSFGKLFIEVLIGLWSHQEGYSLGIDLFAKGEKEKLLESKQRSQGVGAAIKASIRFQQIPDVALSKRFVALLPSEPKPKEEAICQEMLQNLLFLHLGKEQESSTLFSELGLVKRSPLLDKVLAQIFERVQKESQLLEPVVKIYRQANQLALLEEAQHLPLLTLFVKHWIAADLPPDFDFVQKFFSLEDGNSKDPMSVSQKIELMDGIAKHHSQMKRRNFPLILKESQRIWDNPKERPSNPEKMALAELLMQTFPDEWRVKCPCEEELVGFFKNIHQPSEQWLSFDEPKRHQLLEALLKTELKGLREIVQPLVLATTSAKLWQLLFKASKKYQEGHCLPALYLAFTLRYFSRFDPKDLPLVFQTILDYMLSIGNRDDDFEILKSICNLMNNMQGTQVELDLTVDYQVYYPPLKTFLVKASRVLVEKNDFSLLYELFGAAFFWIQEELPSSMQKEFAPMLESIYDISFRNKKFKRVLIIDEGMLKKRFSKENQDLIRFHFKENTWREVSSENWFEFTRFEEARMRNYDPRIKESDLIYTMIYVHLYVALEIPQAYLEACQLAMNGKAKMEMVIEEIVGIFLKFPKDHPQIVELTRMMQALLFSFAVQPPPEESSSGHFPIVSVIQKLIDKNESEIVFDLIQARYFQCQSLSDDLKRKITPILKQFLIPSLHKKNQLASEKICRDWLEANEIKVPVNFDLENSLDVYSPIVRGESTNRYFTFAGMYNGFVEKLREKEFKLAEMAISVILKYLDAGEFTEEEKLPIYNLLYRFMILIIQTEYIYDHLIIITKILARTILLEPDKINQLFNFNFEECGFYNGQRQILNEGQVHSIEGLNEDQVRQYIQQYKRLQKIFNLDLKLLQIFIPLMRGKNFREIGMKLFQRSRDSLKEIGYGSSYPQMSLVTRDLYQMMKDYLTEILRNFHNDPKSFWEAVQWFEKEFISHVLTIQKNDCHQGVKDIAFVQNRSLLSMFVLMTNFRSFFKGMTLSKNRKEKPELLREELEKSVLLETERLQREERVFSCIEGQEMRSQIADEMARLTHRYLFFPLDEQSERLALPFSKVFSLLLYENCVTLGFFQVPDHDRRSLERSIVKVIAYYLGTLSKKDRESGLEELKKAFCKSNRFEYSEKKDLSLEELLSLSDKTSACAGLRT